MPEGDTIHKVAAAMAPRLTRAPVRGLRLAARHGASPRAVRVEGVRAHGKHLLIDLDGARTLRVHLGMYGSWHRYRPGEAWKKPARRASVVLETEGHVFVCFSAKEVQVLDSGGLAARELFHRLGPDLLDPATGVDALVERARRIADGTAPLVDVLLDQRIACGVGNVIRRETDLKTNLLTLDELRLKEGDWIDIGEPLVAGQVFPVTVKSLVFH